MKAAFIHAPRDLRIEEAEVAEMGPGEVTVRIRAGGICGSDLHYYLHGGFGAIRIRQPMILGHEIAGEVVAAGPAVTSVRAGDQVAVNPSAPCGHCKFCLAGQVQPLPGHAVLRKRDADAARAWRLPRGPGLPGGARRSSCPRA